MTYDTPRAKNLDDWVVEDLVSQGAVDENVHLLLGAMLVLGCCRHFSVAVTFSALFQAKTTVWKGIPLAAAMVIFLFCVVGMLEAMQVAFFAVSKICAADRGSNVFAMKTAHLLFSGAAKNLPDFMVGRQLCVESCMFFLT